MLDIHNIYIYKYIVKNIKINMASYKDLLLSFIIIYYYYLEKGWVMVKLVEVLNLGINIIIIFIKHFI